MMRTGSVPFMNPAGGCVSWNLQGSDSLTSWRPLTQQRGVPLHAKEELANRFMNQRSSWTKR
jgi:hypothetical protein